jgi:hypothetical protein
MARTAHRLHLPSLGDIHLLPAVPRDRRPQPLRRVLGQVHPATTLAATRPRCPLRAVLGKLPLEPQRPLLQVLDRCLEPLCSGWRNGRTILAIAVEQASPAPQPDAALEIAAAARRCS